MPQKDHQEGICVFNSTDLVDLALKEGNMHSEMLRQKWSDPYISDFLTSPWWGNPKKGTIVTHSLNWAPLMLNFSKVKRHDTSTFRTQTIDCDYIYRNFSNLEKVYGIQSSKDAFLVSFTPEADLSFFPIQKNAQSIYTFC